MATTLYLRDDPSSINPGTDEERTLATTRGALSTAYVKRTMAGAVTPPTVATQFTKVAEGAPQIWYSDPISAAVTIAGTVTFNLWVNESNNKANATVTMELLKSNNAGTTLTVISACALGRAELTTTMASVIWQSTPISTALAIGDRLAARVYIDDASGVTMATGNAVTMDINGPSFGADGDSWLSATETLSFSGAAIDVSTAATCATSSSMTKAPTVSIVTPISVSNASPVMLVSSEAKAPIVVIFNPVNVSNASPIMTSTNDAKVPSVVIVDPQPVLPYSIEYFADQGNNGNATDLSTFYFKTPTVITNIASARVFIVPTSQMGIFTLDAALAISDPTYYRSTTPSSPNTQSGFVYFATHLDCNGNAIVTGISYTAVIVSIAVVGWLSTMAVSSNTVTLTTNAPAPDPTSVYLYDYYDTNTGYDLTVSFTEPVYVANTTGYKVAVVRTANVNIITAELLAGLASNRYVSVTTSGSNYGKNANFNGKVDIEGNAIVNGVSYSAVLQPLR